MESNISNRSVKYLDNHLSLCSMKIGKCEIIGWLLPDEAVHFRHFTPVCLGGKGGEIIKALPIPIYKHNT